MVLVRLLAAWDTLSTRQGMVNRDSVAGYDAFAGLYDRYWGRVTVDRFLPAYDRLLLARLAPGSTVLDLCCGSGQLAAVLAARGHQVIGIDVARRMLARAQQNVPSAVFVAADARWFGLGPICQAVVSTFDSLNHMMSLDDLELVFRNVRRALVPGGAFAFDLNMEEGYRARWGDSFGFVGDDHACIVRASYRAEDRLATFDLTAFERQGERRHPGRTAFERQGERRHSDQTAFERQGERRHHDRTAFQRQGEWRRFDLTLVQRPYAADEVLSALRRSGLTDPAVFDAADDLGLHGEVGRAFFVCRRPERIGERDRARGLPTT